MKKILLSLLLVCLSLPLPVMATEFIKTRDLSFVNEEIPFDQYNAWTTVLINSIDENGLYVTDDPSTIENESYESTTIRRVVQEFTFCNIIDDVLYVQITGGYIGTCFNYLKYPITEEIKTWFLGHGELISNEKYIDVLSKNIEIGNI